MQAAGRKLRALPGLACGCLVLALVLPAAHGAWRHGDAGAFPAHAPRAPLAARQATARGTLVALEQREAALASDAAATALRLAAVRRSLSVAQRNLARRIRALYEDGETQTLEVVLGARSFGDAITEIEDLQRTASQDREWISRSQALGRQLVQLSRSLAARRVAIQRLRISAAATVAQATATGVAAEPTAPPSLPRHGRTNTLVGTRARAPAIPAAVTVVASAYALPGTTATGAPVGYGTVAVDPAVIPLGTSLDVPGYGAGVASDTGSAVRGARVDVWFPTIEEALAWGTRTVTVTIHGG